MNYYERHLGDYARDTAHLSILEHGVYTLLLDRYYATEAPIPADQAHRVARARSRDERAAVDAVLAEFFTLDGDMYRNKRADEMIEQYHEAEPEREAKRANGKDRVRRCRERRKAIFDALRERDVVPKWDTPMEELETLLKRVTAQPVTRYATANQTPDTKHQTPIKETHTLDTGGSLPSEDSRQSVTAVGSICMAMKGAGLAMVQPAHPKLLALIAQGASEAQFVHAAREAVSRGKGFAYALGALEGQMRDAASMTPAKTKPEVIHENNRNVAEQWAGTGVIHEQH